MEKEIKPVGVRILDKDYTVACPQGEQEALLASARRVDKEMRRIRDSGKVLGSDRIAVMVALNLAHELMQNKQQQQVAITPTSQITEQLQQLQQRIDAVLDKHKS
ncbi:MAG: cell division protein ZapA [Thiothrix lacustris]|uniref:Cell division protein ZapA n=1 Tax=Thiothrix lacustris TaxID=525917 RepID=A0A1Y1QDI0_9GAMM|nr:MAG: cell division protein ZapA [Thiothrix lacustris]